MQRLAQAACNDMYSGSNVCIHVLYMANACLKLAFQLYFPNMKIVEHFQSSQQPREVGIIIPILSVRKPKSKDIRRFSNMNVAQNKNTDSCAQFKCRVFRVGIRASAIPQGETRCQTLSLWACQRKAPQDSVTLQGHSPRTANSKPVI